MWKKMLLSVFAIMSITCVASAANLDVSVQVTESGNDKIELVTEYDDLDLKWVSGYVEDENGVPVWVGEKRPTKEENLHFYFTATDDKTRNYKAVVGLVGKDDSVTVLEKEFTYYSYAEVQQAMADALAERKTFEQVKDVLSLQFSDIYNLINNKSLIVAEMNTILSGDTNIEHSEFLDAFDRAVVKAALKTKDIVAVESIINNYSALVGITDDLLEKKWYDALSTKASVISKIAAEEYESENAFLQSFRRNVFLEKVSEEHSSTIIAFLRLHNEKYYNSSLELFSLDFGTFDTTLTTTAKKEYAGVLLAQPSYDKSTLVKLNDSFVNAINNAKDYQPPSLGGNNESGFNNNSNSIGGFGYSVPVQSTPDTPKVPVDSQTGFVDIGDAEWARAEIEYCVKNGIVNGKTNSTFCPNDYITREEFTAIIARAFKLVATGEADFADVDKNEWYYESIKAAFSNGIVTGQGNSFGIGENITRQDMAVIMHRVANHTGIDLTAKSNRELNDLSESADYAREAINMMYKAHYINGVSEGIYQPKANATRAQAVKLIYNLLTR